MYPDQWSAIFLYGGAGFLLNPLIVAVAYRRFWQQVDHADKEGAKYAGETNLGYFERRLLLKAAIWWALVVSVAMGIHSWVCYSNGWDRTQTFSLAGVMFLGGFLGLLVSYVFAPKIYDQMLSRKSKGAAGRSSWNMQFRSFLGVNLATSVYGGLIALGVMGVAAFLYQEPGEAPQAAIAATVMSKVCFQFTLISAI